MGPRERTLKFLTGRAGLVGLAVALAAFVVYAPVLSNPFVNADERWLFGSPLIREGLLSQMIVPQPDRAGYMPVGYLILAGVYRAGGDQLRHYHLVSLLLHAANAGLLFFMILSLMRIATKESEVLEPGRLVCSALAAIFFAVHPIQAEGIAVASSLSDLAASFFALASVIFYLRAVKSGSEAERRRRLGVSIGLAALSGLSRWTAAGLPAILAILDLYPLKRLDRRALIEKIPYVLVGAFVVAANTYAKMSPTTVEGVHRLAFQPGGMAAGVIFYVWKWLVPGEFSLYYILDRPAELMGLSVSSCAALLSAAVAVLLWARRRAPAALAAFAIHLVAVAPVLIATNNGWVLAHNRYAYLSGMALAGAAAGGLLEAWKWRMRRRTAFALVPFAVVATACVFFAAQSRGLAAEWHDKSRHGAATLSTDPDAFFAFNVMGEAMLRHKDYAGAVQQFRARFDDHPDDEHARRRLAEYEPLLAAFVLNDKGVALVRAHDMDAAIEHFKQAIAVKPDLIVPYKNLASVLRRLNRTAEAEDYAKRARRLEAQKPSRGASQSFP